MHSHFVVASRDVHCQQVAVTPKATSNKVEKPIPTYLGQPILPLNQLCAKAAKKSKSRKGKSAVIQRQSEIICQWRQEAVSQEFKCRAFEEQLHNTNWEVHRLHAVITEERGRLESLGQAADDEVARLNAHSNVLRDEYLSTSFNLKRAQEELTRTRQDAVDLQKEVNSQREALEAERSRIEKLEAEIKEAEGDHARLSIDIAVANDEVALVKGDLSSEKTLREEAQTSLTASQEEIRQLKERLREQDLELRKKDAIISDIQTQLNATQSAFDDYKEETKQLMLKKDDVIGALNQQSHELDRIALESCDEVIRVQDELDTAHIQIDSLTSQLTEERAAHCQTRLELTQTQAALKASQETAASELSAATARYNALSARLLAKEDALSAACAKLAATQDALEIAEEKIRAEVARLAILEAQLEEVESLAAAARLANEELISKNAELQVTLKDQETQIMVLTQSFQRECDAHQATLGDVQSLQTRLAVVSKDLKLATETKVVEEKQQLEQSKRSIEKLLAAKISRCDELERELTNLRGSSLSSTTSGPSTPLTSVTNMTPPARVAQKKAKGGNWFKSGGFSPIVSTILHLDCTLS